MDPFYHFKHWLLTILIAPIFLIISFSIEDKKLVVDFILIYFISIFAGLVLSTPAFLVYCIVFHIALDRIESVFVMKTILSLTAIAGIFITLYFMDQSISLTILIPYSAATILCSWLIPIKKRTLPQINQNPI